MLEGNLPPDLLQSPETSASAVTTTAVETTTETAATAKPAAVADPFGFGAAAGAVIVKRSKGFPGQARTAAALLDDKRHVQELRSRYREWGLVAETAAENAGNDYDDEYDDSYDALAESERRGGVGRSGPSAAAVRNPNRAVRDELFDDGEEDDEDEEDEDEDAYAEEEQAAGGGAGPGPSTSGRGAAAPTSSYYDKSRNFCENPEIARERRAQMWNNKWAARGPRRPAAAAAASGATGAARPAGG